MIETERIEFPDGDWWEIRKKLTHGTQRALTASQRDALIVKEQKIEVDWDKVNLDDVNDILLLRSTTAWSFGEVTASALAEVPEEYCNQMLRRLTELYGLLPLAEASGSG